MLLATVNTILRKIRDLKTNRIINRSAVHAAKWLFFIVWIRCTWLQIFCSTRGTKQNQSKWLLIRQRTKLKKSRFSSSITTIITYYFIPNHPVHTHKLLPTKCLPYNVHKPIIYWIYVISRFLITNIKIVPGRWSKDKPKKHLMERSWDNFNASKGHGGNN